MQLFSRGMQRKHRTLTNRLRFENLENRLLLAVDIQWHNRGVASGAPYVIPDYDGLDLEPDDSDTPDNFNWVFCQQFQSCALANNARDVVDAALESWEDIINSFNDENNEDDVYTVTIAMDFLNNGCGGEHVLPAPAILQRNP